MYFPKFWAKAEHNGASCWRWSDINAAAALSEAQRGAKNLAAQFINGFPAKNKNYEYGTRPLREEIIEENKDQNGNQSAILTRNRYGALVLNTSDVMFIDIDLEPSEKSSGLLSYIGSFFAKQKDKTADLLSQALENIKNWCRLNSNWGFRIYRTPAGLRLLATHNIFSAEKITSTAVFDELKVDPLYKRLCKNQKCFRARLTPKPWRCKVRLPPAQWPFSNIAQENAFNEWQKTYAAASENLAACIFLEHVGNPYIHPEVKIIMDLHDKYSKALSGLKIA